MNKSTKKSYSLLNNVIRTLKLFWRIDKFSLLSYMGLILLQVVSSILVLYFGSRIIGELTKLIHDQSTISNIYRLIGASTIAILCERLAWRGMNYFERKSWIKWYVEISVEFNRAVSGLDVVQHHDNDFEKTLQKVQQEYTYTPQTFATNIMNLIHSVLRLISTLVVVMVFAPWLVIVMVLSLAPGFFAERRLSRLKWDLWGEKGDKPLLVYKITSFLQDKNKLQETKVFGTRDHLINKLEGLHNDFYSRQLMHLRESQRRVFLGITTEILVAAAISVWLIQRVINKTLSLADYSFYSGIILQFGSSLGLIAGSLNFIYDNNEFMKDLYRLFDTTPKLKQINEPHIISSDSIPSIDFEGVSFTYPNSSYKAIDNVSLSIKPEDSIAFVGENGSGKTTMIKLLLRFYDPDEGRILINGVDLRDLDLQSYYAHIGVLFQNFNDYPFSVRDNIALGRVDRFDDDDMVREVAGIANAEKFINKYPKKYDQVLDVSFKEGVEPSGGQWQRIALARALFRDAGILILDEPTAAVDANSEHEIFKTLEKHSKNKTTIIISHRFSTVRQAKTIYVMQEGRIIESGKHTDLMKNKNGLYKEMFEKQAEGYVN